MEVDIFELSNCYPSPFQPRSRHFRGCSRYARAALPLFASGASEGCSDGGCRRLACVTVRRQMQKLAHEIQVRDDLIAFLCPCFSRFPLLMMLVARAILIPADEQIFGFDPLLGKAAFPLGHTSVTHCPELVMKRPQIGCWP